jgi:hypothetical protein
MLPDITPGSLYLGGCLLAVAVAIIWSFFLDRQKPADGKEFLLKLLARAGLLIFLFAVIIGFLSLAIGLFRV